MFTIPEKLISYKTVDHQVVRTLTLPAKIRGDENLNIVFINGHNSLLERIYTMCQYFSRFGNVYSFDLPGFGLSKPFKDKHPSIENYARLIGDFISQEIPEGNIVLLGFSFGFPIASLVTKEQPEIESRIHGYVSLGGFVSRKPMTFNALTYWFLRSMSRAFSYAGFSWIAHWYIHSSLMKFLVNKIFIDRYDHLDPVQKIQANKLKLKCWRDNDIRTHFFTLHEILKTEIEREPITKPAIHLFGGKDNYFDREGNFGCLQALYPNIIFSEMNMTTHSPSYVADEEEIAGYMNGEVEEFFESISKEN